MKRITAVVLVCFLLASLMAVAEAKSLPQSGFRFGKKTVYNAEPVKESVETKVSEKSVSNDIIANVVRGPTVVRLERDNAPDNEHNRVDDNPRPPISPHILEGIEITDVQFGLNGEEPVQAGRYDRVGITVSVDIPFNVQDIRGMYAYVELNDVNNRMTTVRLPSDPRQGLRNHRTYTVWSASMKYLEPGDYEPTVTLHHARQGNYEFPVLDYELEVVANEEAQPPLFWMVSNQEIDEDNNLVLDLSRRVHDANGDDLEFSVVEGPVELISVEGKVLTLEPEQDWNGETQVTIQVSDGEFEEREMFVLTGTPVNDAPICELPDEDIIVDETDEEIVLRLELDDFCTDVEIEREETDELLTYSAEDNREDINTRQEGERGEQAIITYPANINGDTIITMQAFDSEDEPSNEIEITITVRPTPDPCTCNLEDISIEEDTGRPHTLVEDVPAHCEDPDGDSIIDNIGENNEFAVEEQENNFILTELTANWWGNEDVTFNCNDDEQSFNLEVTSENDEPEITDFTVDPNEIFESEEITLRAEFSDADREFDEDEVLDLYVYEEDNEEECVNNDNHDACVYYAEDQELPGEDEFTLQLNEAGEYRYRATVKDPAEATDRSIRRTVTVNELYTVSGVITQLFGVPEDDEDYDSLDEEDPIEGAVITIETLEGEELGNAETNGDGEYTIDLEEEGQYRVIVNADGVYEGIRYIEVRGDMNYNTNIAPEEFNIDLFNLICRQRNGGIQHWLEQPEYQVWVGGIIDINGEVDWDRQPEEEQIELAHSVIGDEDQLHWISNGFINEPEINDIEEEPQWRDRPEGVIYVAWDASGGSHGEDVVDDEIISAIAFVGTRSTPSGYRQEIAQTLGFRDDNDGPNRIEDVLSIFNDAPLERAPDFQLIDSFLGKFLYTRPLSSRTPDVDPEPAEERIQRDELGRRIHTLSISYTDTASVVTEQSFEIIEGQGWTKLDLHPILKKQYYRLEDNEELYFNYDAPKGKRFKTLKTEENTDTERVKKKIFLAQSKNREHIT